MRRHIPPDYTFMGGYILDASGDKWWSHNLLTRTEEERDAARAEVEIWRREVSRRDADIDRLTALLRGCRGDLRLWQTEVEGADNRIHRRVTTLLARVDAVLDAEKVTRQPLRGMP